MVAIFIGAWLPLMCVALLYLMRLFGRKAFIITRRHMLTLYYGGFSKNVCSGEIQTADIASLFPLTVSIEHETRKGTIVPSVLTTLWMGEVDNTKFVEELIWELLIHHSPMRTQDESLVTV